MTSRDRDSRSGRDKPRSSRSRLWNTNAAASDTVINIHYGNRTVSSPTENPTGVWDANFVGVWHLSESSGTIAFDSTANGNHGTYVNGPDLEQPGGFGDLAVAEACFRAAAATNFWPARYNLGLALAQRGALGEARGLFESVTRAAPRFAAGWLQLGGAH